MSMRIAQGVHTGCDDGPLVGADPPLDDKELSDFVGGHTGRRGGWR